MATDSATGALKQITGLSMFWAIAMLVLGFAAILMPLAAGIGVSIVVSWIMVFGGFAYIAYAFAAQSAGAVILRLLIGAAYVVVGGYLAFHPGIALLTLTLAIAAVFLFEGVVETVVFFQFRSLPGSSWILFDGLLTLVLAYLIYRPWPASSAWALGTLVGINLIVSGTTWLMYSAAARKMVKAIA
jgi:uncharacterized membrane protein HdeD (DUF308 family)